MDKKGFTKQIRDGGNCDIITVPKPFMEYEGLKQGDTVKVTLEKVEAPNAN